MNKIIVIPLVCSAAAVIPNIINQSHPHHPQFTVTPTVPGPESVILNTCSLVRKFLHVHLSDEMADNF
jgi:hypothetical protein